MLKVTESKLKGVKIIEPSTNFEDFRGTYVELYNKKEFADNNIDIEFIQDDISMSRKNVLRGLHGDRT